MARPPTTAAGGPVGGRLGAWLPLVVGVGLLGRLAGRRWRGQFVTGPVPAAAPAAGPTGPALLGAVVAPVHRSLPAAAEGGPPPGVTGPPRPVVRARLPVALAVLAILAIGLAARLWDINAIGYNSDEAVYGGQGASLAHDPTLAPYFPTFRAHPLLFQMLLSRRLPPGDRGDLRPAGVGRARASPPSSSSSASARSCTAAGPGCSRR